MTRPSHKELLGKLKVARGLVEVGLWAAADPIKLAANFMELDLYLLDEQRKALTNALREVKPEDYAGARPPARSYERLTKGAEMFAFAWPSDYFGRRMYIKFALVRSPGAQTLFVYSLHPSRGKSGL